VDCPLRSQCSVKLGFVSEEKLEDDEEVLL
jgi:hypothetical protein